MENIFLLAMLCCLPLLGLIAFTVYEWHRIGNVPTDESYRKEQ